MRLGEVIHLYRWQHKLSMQDVSDRTGLAKSHLSNVERGKTEPGIGTLVTLAKLFDVTVSEMLGDVDLSEYDRSTTIMGIPVRVDPDLPADTVELRSKTQTVRLTGIAADGAPGGRKRGGA